MDSNLQQSEIQLIIQIHQKIFEHDLPVYYESMLYPSEIYFKCKINGQTAYSKNPNCSPSHFLQNVEFLKSIPHDEKIHWLDGLKNSVKGEKDKDKKFNYKEVFTLIEGILKNKIVYNEKYNCLTKVS